MGQLGGTEVSTVAERDHHSRGSAYDPSVYPDAQHNRAEGGLSTIVAKLTTVSTAGRHMLATLAQLGGEATIRDIAGTAGIHPNSARATLDTLVEAGLVAKHRRMSGTRGRPAWRYELAAPHSLNGAQDHFVDFIAASLDIITADSDDPTTAAERLGQRWAHTMIARMHIPDHSVFARLTASEQLDVHVHKIRLFLAGQGCGARPGATPHTIVLDSAPIVLAREPLARALRIAHLTMVRTMVEHLSRGAATIDVTDHPEGGYALITMTLSPVT